MHPPPPFCMKFRLTVIQPLTYTVHNAYLFQSFFAIVQGGPEIVSVHDGLKVIHSGHAVGQVDYVSTARRALHVYGEIQRN